MFSRHDSIQELPGAPQYASFSTAPSRVACLPEYFMYYNYLKRLGTRLCVCTNESEAARSKKYEVIIERVCSITILLLTFLFYIV
jgi:hypothetical protein